MGKVSDINGEKKRKRDNNNRETDPVLYLTLFGQVRRRSHCFHWLERGYPVGLLSVVEGGTSDPSVARRGTQGLLQGGRVDPKRHRVEGDRC